MPKPPEKPPHAVPHPEPHAVPRAVPWARCLLLIPIVAMLWVSSYNRIEPTLAGFPFFYLYQLVWVLLSAVIIGIVYAMER
ncbi:MAG: DUF3311 domain-containing protein [Rhodospirillales bacterium]|nr:DUF3311 domain-containing protein [Rhodospirillales bacterium]